VLVLALVHSPLVGPLTWYPMAEELHRRGVEPIVPELADHPSGMAPFWEQHARSVVRALRRVSEERDLVLVAHSGAGPLLPAIASLVERPVSGYAFVDAGVPVDGASRLDLLRGELPEMADQLEAHLQAGGRFPEWTEKDLHDEIPMEGLRRGIVEQVHPRPLSFWTEPIPVQSEWPDGPCFYLKLSDAYRVPFDRAQREGWRTRELEGTHFHMLVEPRAVTDALLDLIGGNDA
jgi:hypothetical protein